MRTARYKSPEEAFYHLMTQVAGSPRYYPLQRPAARNKLLQLIRFYTLVYCCELVAYEIMGSHYHCIVFFQKFRTLARSELEERARMLYGKRVSLKTRNWTPEAWEKFNHKLFDLSALMQHINGEFAKWFNSQTGRRGHFWADRFKNLELLDFESVQECLVYIELNGLRAELVSTPGEWEAGSAYARLHQCDSQLMDLEKIFPQIRADLLFDYYQFLLHFRAGLPTETFEASLGQRVQWILREQKPGRYRKRHRFFIDGLAVSSDQEPIRERIHTLQSRGQYLHRKNPTEQLGGQFFTVREQRSNFRG